MCSRACAYIYYKGIDADSKNQKNNYYFVKKLQKYLEVCKRCCIFVLQNKNRL